MLSKQRKSAFRRVQIRNEQKSIKTENLIDDVLEKGLSDNDYNDEMECDDESSKQFAKS